MFFFGKEPKPVRGDHVRTLWLLTVGQSLSSKVFSELSKSGTRIPTLDLRRYQFDHPGLGRHLRTKFTYSSTTSLFPMNMTQRHKNHYHRGVLIVPSPSDYPTRTWDEFLGDDLIPARARQLARTVRDTQGELAASRREIRQAIQWLCECRWALEELHARGVRTCIAWQKGVSIAMLKNTMISQKIPKMPAAQGVVIPDQLPPSLMWLVKEMVHQLLFLQHNPTHIGNYRLVDQHMKGAFRRLALLPKYPSSPADTVPENITKHVSSAPPESPQVSDGIDIFV